MTWVATHKKHKHPAYKDPFNSYVWDNQITNEIIVVDDMMATPKGYGRVWKVSRKKYTPYYQDGKRQRQVGAIFEEFRYRTHVEAFKKAKEWRRVY